MFTLFCPTGKTYFHRKKKFKKLKYEIVRKQLQTSQNIMKIVSSIRIDKINIQWNFHVSIYRFWITTK